MQSTLSSYFNLYTFTTGRRLFAVSQVRERAHARGATALVGLCDEAIAIDNATATLERQWRKARTVAEGRRTTAAAVDILLDRTVGGLHTQLRSEATTFAGDPRGDAAEKLLSELFPDGAATIVHASYENELAMVDEIVRSMKGAFNPAVTTLGITHFVTRLEKLADDFRAALGKHQVRDVSFDEVRAARDHGQEAMLRVMAAILGEFNSSADADVEARNDLLGPITMQNRRIADYYSRRSTVPDIDPASGDELSVVTDAPAVEPPVTH